MADGPPLGEAEEARHRRGLRFRKREDYAFELFKEAQANLTDPARVDRVLRELGKFYNPLVDAPIVDLATRRQVMELLAAGLREDASRALDERLRLYAPLEGGEAPGER